MTIPTRILSRLAAALLAFAAGTAGGEIALRARWVVDPEAMNDPRAPYWKDIEAVRVPMQPQIVVTPRHAEIAVKELKVRAAHNGHRLAFLIEWTDQTK